MSKARLFRSIKALDAGAVAALLEEQPGLKDARDERRRNPLHFLCGLAGADPGRRRSLAVAERLLAAGIDVNGPAFVEDAGAFQATPLWYAIARGRNLPLARFLLGRGATPEFCLWAAAFNDDVEAIDLLVASGATIEAVAEDATPFLFAIAWSRFAAAERLLRHGANVNAQNSKGVTALHRVLEKGSDRRHVEMLLRYGADPRVQDRAGTSPLSMVERRRDRTWFDLLSASRPLRARARRRGR